MADQNLSFSIRMPYKVRCNLPDCGKAVNQVYKVGLDGYSINFCSNDHARTGITRWQDKIARGIKPGQKVAPVNDDEMTGDNLNEIEGE
jgi:hypothetical protein